MFRRFEERRNTGWKLSLLPLKPLEKVPSDIEVSY
jgi:hypothetical protein